MLCFFFYSHVLYGILGRGSTSKTEKNIQILQNKVLRIINNFKCTDRITNNTLYRKFNILKISDVYKFEVSKFMYTYHKKSLPEIFESYFLPIELAYIYNTRSKSKQNYFLNSAKTNCGKNSIKHFGVQVWNQIPPEIKSYSLCKFKKEFHKILLKNYEYKKYFSAGSNIFFKWDWTNNFTLDCQ